MLRRIGSGFCLLLLTSSLWAQSSNQIQQLNHVYSQNGFGIVNTSSNVRTQALGLTGVASPGRFSVNHINPALLTYNNASSFEFGINTHYISASNEAGVNAQNIESGIGDLRLSLPVKRNRWQTMLGVRQYSKISYYANFMEAMPNFAEDSLYAMETIDGQGGLNEVSWKNGFNITSDLHVGFDLSYYFGNANYRHQNYVQSADSNLNYTAPSYDNNDLRGIYQATGSQPLENIIRKNFRGVGASVGLSYYQDVEPLNMGVFLGATYDLMGDVNINVNQRTYDGFFLNTNSGRLAIGDTLEFDEPALSIPRGWNAGITFVFRDSLKDDRFQLSLESNAQSYLGISQSRYGLGMERYADFNSKNGLDHFYYRLGGYYSENAIAYQNGVNEFGITFGLGIPMKPSREDRNVRSIVDLGVTMGTRGEATNGLVKESFIRANISLTFNDRWFKQIRIN